MHTIHSVQYEYSFFLEYYSCVQMCMIGISVYKQYAPEGELWTEWEV